MQRKFIAAAVTAALAGATAPAFALLPAAFNTATASETYMSGASAQEGQLVAMMRDACQAGTLDVFRQANQFVFFCTANQAVTGTLAKPNIVVYKSSVGGSGNGTLPVNNASNALQFMDIATLNPAGCAAAVTVSTGTLPSYQDHASCTQTLVNGKVTQIGLSDVEPSKFIGLVPGLNSAAQLSNLKVNPINQLLFGVPVTLGLRNALQTAQGLTSGAEDEANMPSLTKAQITAIYTGSLPSPTWDNFGLTNPNDPVNAIWVARRVGTSGTQTATKIYFLNDPCSSGVAQFVTDGTVANEVTASNALACSSADPLAAGFTPVYQGSGSQNVVDCLNAHDANNRWAVGVLSTEFVPGTGSNGNGFRYIKVDGVAPTLYNAAQGRYQFVAEATLQYRQNTNALAGDSLVLAKAMVAGFNKPSVISLIDSSLVHPFGNSGLLGVPGGLNVPSNPITRTNILTNPVSAFTHSSSGATNNCQPLQAVQPGSKTGFAN